MIGQTLGQYKIVNLLGKGGMATVYRAYQESVGRDVAFKVIKADLSELDQFSERFKREAHTVAGLSHPHILKVFDYGRHESVVYLVMELMTGGSLTELIRSDTLTLSATTRLLEQISGALDYAHRRGIIHRDLKPANVLIDEDQNAFLTDFGIAKLLNTNTGLTQTGSVMGTPSYMPPEQWSGGAVDARTDVYALGVMLYEMVVGKVPFSADTPFHMMYKHLNEAPPSLVASLPNLPPAVDQVINRALAKNPDDRYGTASDLSNAFRTALGESVSTASSLINVTTVPSAGATSISSTPPLMRAPGAKISEATSLVGPSDPMIQVHPRRPLLIGIGVIALIAVLLGVGVAVVATSGAAAANQTKTAQAAAIALLQTQTAYVTVTVTASATPTALSQTLVTSGITALAALDTQVSPVATSRPVITSTPIAIAILASPAQAANVPPPPANLLPIANTLQPLTATLILPTNTVTPSTTPVPPTSTSTALPPTTTFTPSTTPVPPSSTSTPLPPTATFTPTATLIPPTSTFTPSSTPVPPTSTSTPLPPTITNTAVPATLTPTVTAPIVTVASTLPPTQSSGTAVAVLPSGGHQLALISRVSGQPQLFTVNSDSTNLTRITDTTNSNYVGPLAWSPDGSFIAFLIRTNTSQSIWVINVDGTNPTRYAAGAYPVWSPDSKQIAYVASQNGRNDITVMDSYGQNARIVVQGVRSIFVGWSPDSKQLVYLSGGVWTVDISAAKLVVHQLNKDAPSTFAAWSPQGKQIAVVSGAAIYLLDAGTGAQQPLVKNGSTPNWSHDGQHIAYTSAGNVFVIDADGTNQKQLAMGSQPLWSPDDKQIAYTNNSTVVVMNADGTNQKQVSSGQDFTWAP